MSNALITNRDGIVGLWEPGPVPNPSALGLDSALNLERWEPWVRASIFDFEMFSRLGFSRQGASADQMTVWHLEVTPTGINSAPAAVYHPLARMVRPSVATFKAQLDFLHQYADLRPDRGTESLVQVDGPIAFLSSIAYLHPDRSRWTLELLAAAFRLARFVEMRLKHALGCRRPIEFSPQVQPIILTPSHGSLPSGHATEVFIMALVLWNLLRAPPARTRPMGTCRTAHN